MGIGGALMGALNANSASNQSWQRQHQLMEIQAELNRKNAKFNTAQAKEMWNYTNFENQMKHIKEAGLSPGLIYGMGGQGGSTQGAGAANGVGLPQDQSVGMGLRAQEIGVEMANALSQIKLNESQANKNEAEANKIKGVSYSRRSACNGLALASCTLHKPSPPAPSRRGLGLLGKLHQWHWRWKAQGSFPLPSLALDVRKPLPR